MHCHIDLTMARREKTSHSQPSGFAEERQPPFDAKPPSPANSYEFVELGAGGRLVIPAPFRAALGMKPGQKLTVRLEGNELRIYTRREGIRRVQEMMSKYDLGTVDEFIAEKRKEAAREMKEFDDE